MFLLSLGIWLDKLPLSLSFIQLAVAETNQAVQLCEAQELQACHCWFYSPLCPGLRGSTCMTAWMIKFCSESVRTGRHERHYQCSSCQTWRNQSEQSVTKPGTSGFTESLILLNEKSDLRNKCSLLQDDWGDGRESVGFLATVDSHTQQPTHTPTEMLSDLVIKAPKQLQLFL